MSAIWLRITMRYKGKLVTWKDDQGFGFISPTSGGDDVYVHIKSFSNRDRRPVMSDDLNFELTAGADGRSQAVKVAFEGESFIEPPATSIRAVAALVFLIAISILAMIGNLHQGFVWLYFSMSAATFIAYGMDKEAAKNNQTRISEDSLLMWGIIGGWPGALIGQWVFRHKTIKSSFQASFWISVVTNCAVLIFIASPTLRAFILSFR
jgi:uncharacterized membrane protein YsdA (DUF1294 family)/cold shock CspA family protein